MSTFVTLMSNKYLQSAKDIIVIQLKKFKEKVKKKNLLGFRYIKKYFLKFWRVEKGP